jgi:hypothetical protein
MMPRLVVTRPLLLVIALVVVLTKTATAFVSPVASGGSSSSYLSALEPKNEVGVLPPVGFFE